MYDMNLADISGTKKREYLEGAINELETNSKTRNVRNLCIGINEFKKGFQPRANLGKDEKGGLLADFHIVLNRWKYDLLSFDVRGVNDVRQTNTYSSATTA
jgi:hypothetical protein